MCYSNGRRIDPAEFGLLIESIKKPVYLSERLAIYKGFDYSDFPIIRPVANTRQTERINMQWGFLPPYLKNDEDVQRFRNGYKDATGKWRTGFTTLNATSEQLLEKMFQDAALHRRCLVPSNGYYEWMHVQVVGKSGKLLKTPEKFPYLVQMRNQEEFYMAGIWQPWVNKETGMVTNTFAIVTTSANTLMKQIHNSKERMPTILPGDIAEAWLYNDLTADEIKDIANYQVASIEMVATPLHKDFLKREDPHEPVEYKEVPKLVLE